MINTIKSTSQKSKIKATQTKKLLYTNITSTKESITAKSAT